MRSVIFTGLAAMAIAPAVAQMPPTSPATPGQAQTPGRTPGHNQMQAPDQMQGQTQTGSQAQAQRGAMAGDTGQPASSGNQILSGDVTPQLTTGAKVFDTAGAEVGTIEEVKGAMVVISTGNAKATLANTAFARGSIGPVIAMTKAQVEAAVQKTKGAMDTAAGTPRAR